jgi:hypothetical protein
MLFRAEEAIASRQGIQPWQVQAAMGATDHACGADTLSLRVDAARSDEARSQRHPT